MKPMRRLFKQANIASQDNPMPAIADVLVDESGVIRDVSPDIPPSTDMKVLDCSNKILLPGLFDMHVHLREPGREDKETIETGTNAAINGGISGILAMPNTDPPIDSGGMVRFVRAMARDRSGIPVLTSGCITKGRAGKSLADLADMHTQGAVMITDDGSPVADPYLFRRALEYSRHFDIIVASHCEVPELSRGGAMNEGAQSYRLGLPGIPACSEEISIERDLRLAQCADARIHIQHISTARGLAIIRRFKEEGVRVTCEVTPHHLLFSDNDIQDYNTHLKMNPPLRSPEDNKALLDGLNEGLIDVIATDHAPHTRFEKELDFASSPFGITGLDTALISLFTHLINKGLIGWDCLVRRFASEPRRILQLEPADIVTGSTADFIVFDPNGRTHVNNSFIKSKSINTPYLGLELCGSVDMMVRGTEILLDRGGCRNEPLFSSKGGME